MPVKMMPVEIIHNDLLIESNDPREAVNAENRIVAVFGPGALHGNSRRIVVHQQWRNHADTVKQ
jgi:hypothetical protein